MNICTTHDAPEKILVVDDNPKNLRVLYSLLSAKGYDVRPVLTPEQALLSVQGETPPDLILLDIMMPEMNGFQLCEQLKADKKSAPVPIIFISAMDHVDDKLKGFSVGGVDYITKPFQEEEVLARVSTQLTLRNQQKNLEKKNAQLKTEICKRKQIEKQLRKAKQDADIANEAKTTFLSNISHELRTPLNSIIGFATLLLDTLLNERQLEFSQIIERSGQSLLALINEILELGKIEAGQLKIVQQNFCLFESIHEVIELMKIPADEKKIDLILKIDENLPAFVYGDPNRLSQILINLLNNAIKFTEKGSVTLHVFNVQPYQAVQNDFISIVSLPTPINLHEKRICFEIKDTGIGISPEHVDTIFKPFEQTGDHHFRKQGTGLGLAICKKLIKILKGRLYLMSQLDEGTTFRADFYMPIMHNANTHTFKMERKIIGIKGQHPVVLIAENDQNSYKLLKELLIPIGFIVELANDGQEALKKAVANVPDVLITDLHLPDLHGIKLIREIRNLDTLKNLPVIVSSASVFSDIMQKSISAGSQFFLPKPVNADVLYQQLQNVLNIEWQYADDSASNSFENQLCIPAPPIHKNLYEGPVRTVLIVDDTPANCQLLTIMLKSQNLNVIVAENGSQAIQQAKKNNPDIIFMDVVMPTMDGLETTKHIRFLPNLTQVPIIALSARIGKNNFHEYSPSGFTDFLAKPVSLNHLNACLKKYLNINLQASR
ncbi:MAG: response regulator [Candidatus Magnetomorum sp.]|nr:response regulator [Candidatus Magnetomorum sp.]